MIITVLFTLYKCLIDNYSVSYLPILHLPKIFKLYLTLLYQISGIRFDKSFFTYFFNFLGHFCFNLLQLYNLIICYSCDNYFSFFSEIMGKDITRKEYDSFVEISTRKEYFACDDVETVSVSKIRSKYLREIRRFVLDILLHVCTVLFPVQTVIPEN